MKDVVIYCNISDKGISNQCIIYSSTLIRYPTYFLFKCLMMASSCCTVCCSIVSVEESVVISINKKYSRQHSIILFVC